MSTGHTDSESTAEDLKDRNSPLAEVSNPSNERPSISLHLAPRIKSSITKEMKKINQGDDLSDSSQCLSTGNLMESKVKAIESEQLSMESQVDLEKFADKSDDCTVKSCPESQNLPPFCSLKPRKCEVNWKNEGGKSTIPETLKCPEVYLDFLDITKTFDMRTPTSKNLLESVDSCSTSKVSPENSKKRGDSAVSKEGPSTIHKESFHSKLQTKVKVLVDQDYGGKEKNKSMLLKKVTVDGKGSEILHSELPTSKVEFTECPILNQPECSPLTSDEDIKLCQAFRGIFVPQVSFGNGQTKNGNDSKKTSEERSYATHPPKKIEVNADKPLKFCLKDLKNDLNLSTAEDKQCDEKPSSVPEDLENDDVFDFSEETTDGKVNAMSPTTMSVPNTPPPSLKFLLRKLSLEKYRKKRISPLLHALISPTKSTLRKLVKKGYIKKEHFKSTNKKSNSPSTSKDNSVEDVKKSPSVKTLCSQSKSSLIVGQSQTSNPKRPKEMKISPLISPGSVVVKSRVVMSPNSLEEKSQFVKSNSNSERRKSPRLRLFPDNSVARRINVSPASSKSPTSLTSWLTIHSRSAESVKSVFPKLSPLARSHSEEYLPSAGRSSTQPPVKKSRCSLDGRADSESYPPDNLYRRFSVGLIGPEQEVEEILFYMYSNFTEELIFSVDVVSFHAFVNRIDNFNMPFCEKGADIVSDTRMTDELQRALLGLLDIYVFEYEDTVSDILLHPEFDYNVFRKCLIQFWSKFSTSKYDIVRFLIFCTMVSTFAVNAFEQGILHAFRFTSLLICHAIEYYKHFQNVQSIWVDLEEFVLNMELYSTDSRIFLEGK